MKKNFVAGNEMNELPISVCRVLLDEKMTLAFTNLWFRKELEYKEKRESWGEQSFLDLIYKEDRLWVTDNLLSRKKETGTEAFVDARMLCSNRTIKWMRIRAKIDGDSKDDSGLLVLIDINRQKQIEQELAFHKSLHTDIFLSYNVNFSTNKVEEKIEVLNSNFKWLLALPMAEASYSALIKKYCLEHISLKYRFLYSILMNPSHVRDIYHEGRRTLKMDHKVMENSGEEVWVRTVVNLIEDETSSEIKGFVYHQNIDDKKKKAVTMKYQAQRDELTGLYNRRAIMLTMGKILTETPSETKRNNSHAFIILDLDNFKLVNDTYGHQEGDWVLKETAAYIVNAFGKDNLVGRLGGDEFVILIKEIESKDEALQKVGEICREIQHLHSGVVLEPPLSASAGICFFPEDGTSWEELYERADEALYIAKGEGKNRVDCYRK